MKVSELITLLQAQPQHLTVVYKLHSEQAMLEADDIYVDKLCVARPDGWVANARPDKPLQEYLILPGN